MTRRNDEGRTVARTCEQASRAPDYRLGELSPDEAAAYARHAATCDACTRAITAFDRVAAALRAPTGPTASPELVDRVLAQLPEFGEAAATGSASVGRPSPRASPLRPRAPNRERAHRLRFLPARPYPWARVAALMLIALGLGGLWLARIRTEPPAAAVARHPRAESAAWLRRTQRADGGWSAGQDTFDVGVSGVALLALTADLRAGEDAANRKAIRRGVEFLLSQQQTNGLFGPVFAAGTYNHGLATLAMLEAGTAVGTNARWQAATRRAVDCLAGIQDRTGGWSYLNRDGGGANTSASVWPLLALLRADGLGFAGLRPRIARGLAWMRTTIGANGLMGYQRVDEAPQGQTTLTAAGAFCLLKAEGGSRDPVTLAMLGAVRDAAAQLARLGEPVDYYRAFFVCQALALAGDDTSRDAQAALNGRLLATQNREGDVSGSWTPHDAWSAAGGPVYATALTALALD